MVGGVFLKKMVTDNTCVVIKELTGLHRETNQCSRLINTYAVDAAIYKSTELVILEFLIKPLNTASENVREGSTKKINGGSNVSDYLETGQKEKARLVRT